MIKGSKIEDINTGKIYTVDSVLEMDDISKSVVFTEEGVCLPVIKSKLLKEDFSIFDSSQDEDLLKLQFKIFGCSSVEDRLRRKILNEKLKLGLLKWKFWNVFGFQISLCIDDRSNHLESWHLHVNARSRFVYRSKTKTYSMAIEKSK